MRLEAVVPVFNGGVMLPLCVDALRQAGLPADRICVVDDGSTDGVAQSSANSEGLRYIAIEPLPDGNTRGPAYARNLGSSMSPDAQLLMFVDADVTVHKSTVSAFVSLFSEDASIDAAFGSYDTNPPHKGWVSQYKNLLHHYMHQHGNRNAGTFWSGCGVVRRHVFETLGGFDESYRTASVEDVEFGMRLVENGYRVALCPEIQCQHLKQWTVTSWLRTDIVQRAAPWTRLLIDRGNTVPDSLNTSLAERLSALLALGSLFCILLSIVTADLSGGFAIVAGLQLVLFLIVQRKLLAFLIRSRGIVFALFGMLCHLVYLICASCTYLVVQVKSKLGLYVATS